MKNIVKDEKVTLDIIIEIADRYRYESDDVRLEAINKMSNNVLSEKSMDELIEIAEEYAFSDTDIDLEQWADSRGSSMEVVEAIFEKANGDALLADKIWEDGDDEVVKKAFKKTSEDELYWGIETFSRADYL